MVDKKVKTSDVQQDAAVQLTFCETSPTDMIETSVV